VSGEVEQVLGTVGMYRRLSAEDRRRLAEVSTLRQYARGDEIFAEGDAAAAFFVVVQGRVKVVKSTPTGREVLLEIFGPGDPLGAVVAYEGKPFPATARALEPTRCVVTPRETFFRLLAEHPSLVRGLLSGLTLRLIELTNRLAAVSGARVEERVARLFLQKLDELGRPEGGGQLLPLPLTRQEVADLAGTTIETAIRVMSRWSKAQLVLTRDDGFLVLDRAALERMAGLP